MSMEAPQRGSQGTPEEIKQAEQYLKVSDSDLKRKEELRAIIRPIQSKINSTWDGDHELSEEDRERMEKEIGPLRKELDEIRFREIKSSESKNREIDLSTLTPEQQDLLKKCNLQTGFYVHPPYGRIIQGTIEGEEIRLEATLDGRGEVSYAAFFEEGYHSDDIVRGEIAKALWDKYQPIANYNNSEIQNLKKRKEPVLDPIAISKAEKLLAV